MVEWCGGIAHRLGRVTWREVVACYPCSDGDGDGKSATYCFI